MLALELDTGGVDTTIAASTLKWLRQHCPSLVDSFIIEGGEMALM